jgi:hypothetical protein
MKSLLQPIPHAELVMGMMNMMYSVGPPLLGPSPGPGNLLSVAVQLILKKAQAAYSPR